MPHVDKDCPAKCPLPRLDPEQISPDEFALLPEKFELVDGYITGSKEGAVERLTLLGLLLRNCRLAAAAKMSDPFEWREASDREFGDFFETQERLWREATEKGEVR